MNKAEEIADRLTKWANRLGFSTVSGDLSEIIKDIAATHPKESAGVWRKASEGLPDLVMSVNLKINGRPGFGKFFQSDHEGICLGFEASNGFGTLFPFQFDDVLWLDESQSASAAPTADGMEDGWISVEDRLPENNGWTNDRILFYDGTCVRNGCYDYEFGDWTEQSGGIYKNATHWRPLPTPPTTKKD